MKFVLPQIYPITDTRLSGLSHCEQVARLVAGGARLIQLREKYMAPRLFYDDAEKAIEMAHANDVQILINDRVDIAMALGADGVHLGQTDLAPERARHLLGKEKIIGFSTHSVTQVIAAKNLDVDYIAIGPVFETVTKEDAGPVVGLNGVVEARNAIPDLPLIGIGGISVKTAGKVLGAGADSVAMISEILTHKMGITAGYRTLSASLIQVDGD